MDALIAAAIVADCVLAAGVRQLQVSRSGDARILLGQTGTVTLSIANPGRRRAAGRRAGRLAAQRRRRSRAGCAVADPARRPGQRHHHAAARAPRGPARGPGDGALLRAAGAGRAAGQPARRRGRSGCCRRSSAAGTCRRSWPGCASSTASTAVMVRGQGTEFDSLREYVLGDDVRSIDWRSTARLTDVMVRTWRPERDRRIIVVLDTGRTSAGRVGGMPRLDASMDAALLLAALASRAGDRVDLLAVDRRVRARVDRRRARRAAGRADRRHGGAGRRAHRAGLPADGQRGAGRGPAALPGGAADRPESGRGGRGAAAQDRAAHLPVPGADRRGRRPAGERDGGGARRRRGGLRGRGRRAGPGRAGPHLRCSSGAAAWTSWMPRRTGCRPRWPTPTCA